VNAVAEAAHRNYLVSRICDVLSGERIHLQNAILLIVCNVSAAGLLFVANVKIANVIGKESFGNLAYATALGMFGQAIVRYGMDRTLVRDLIHYPHRFSELVAGSLLLRGAIMALVAAGLVVWKIAFDPDHTFLWGMIAVVVAYSLKSFDLQPVYDAWLKMARHSFYNLIQRGLYFIFIFLIIYASPMTLSITWIGFGMLATEIFYQFLQQRWAFRRIDFGTIKTPLVSVSIDLAGSNFWIWLATMAMLSFGAMNQVILRHYCGAAELGKYAASGQIASAALLLFAQVARIGNPATAHNTKPNADKKARIQFLLQYSGVMLLIAIPICAPLFIFPELILNTLYKPEYVSAIPVLRIFAIYMLVISLGMVASQYVVSSRMVKTFFCSIILGALVSIALCMVLIPRMGSYGAALALLIGHGTTMGLYWVITIQHVRRIGEA
jgi:O-antigen/teichoic acid export membrane protein